VSDWKLDGRALDRYITGNWGEDQERDEAEGEDWGGADETPMPTLQDLLTARRAEREAAQEVDRNKRLAEAEAERSARAHNITQYIPADLFSALRMEMRPTDTSDPFCDRVAAYFPVDGGALLSIRYDQSGYGSHRGVWRLSGPDFSHELSTYMSWNEAARRADILDAIDAFTQEQARRAEQAGERIPVVDTNPTPKPEHYGYPTEMLAPGRMIRIFTHAGHADGGTRFIGEVVSWDDRFLLITERDSKGRERQKLIGLAHIEEIWLAD
jgi:hypothetical protein